MSMVVRARNATSTRVTFASGFDRHHASDVSFKAPVHALCEACANGDAASGRVPAAIARSSLLALYCINNVSMLIYAHVVLLHVQGGRVVEDIQISRRDDGGVPGELGGQDEGADAELGPCVLNDRTTAIGRARRTPLKASIPVRRSAGVQHRTSERTGPPRSRTS